MPKFLPFDGLRPIIPVIRQNLRASGWISDDGDAEDRHLYDAFIRPLTEAGLATDETHREIKKLFQSQKETSGLKSYGQRYFFYRQQQPIGQVYRGFLGLSDVRDYLSGNILPHEKTLPHKVDMLEKFTDHIGVQAEPVLLMYPSVPDLELIMNLKEQQQPLYDWTDANGTLHGIWLIEDEGRHQKITESFNQADHFFIADGHHRMEASAQYYKNRIATDPSTDVQVLSFMVSSQSVRIHDFNRIVKLPTGETPEDLLKKLQNYFLIDEVEKFPQPPKQKFEFFLITEAKNYHLILKSGYRVQPTEYEELDHSIFVKYILGDIFGIVQPETSPDIQFISGSSDRKGLEKLFRAVHRNSGWVGFALPAVHFFEIKNMAEQGRIMPAKCTFIEPKLPPAILIYERK